jgi:hypothetical protein
VHLPPTATGARGLPGHGWSRSCFFPRHRPPGSHVPNQSQIEHRAAYMPDGARAVSAIPKLIPEDGSTPAFPPGAPSRPWQLIRFRQRFACARLGQSYLSKSCSDFSAPFTTVAFDHSSLRWFEISTPDCRARRPSSISRTVAYRRVDGRCS